MGFPGGSDSKTNKQTKKNKTTCNTGDLGSKPGLGRVPGGGHGNPLLPGNLMDRGAWRATVPVHGVTKSQTVLSTYTRTENKRKTEKYGHVNNNITFK